MGQGRLPGGVAQGIVAPVVVVALGIWVSVVLHGCKLQVLAAGQNPLIPM